MLDFHFRELPTVIFLQQSNQKKKKGSEVHSVDNASNATDSNIAENYGFLQ